MSQRFSPQHYPLPGLVTRCCVKFRVNQAENQRTLRRVSEKKRFLRRKVTWSCPLANLTHSRQKLQCGRWSGHASEQRPVGIRRARLRRSWLERMPTTGFSLYYSSTPSILFVYHSEPLPNHTPGTRWLGLGRSGALASPSLSSAAARVTNESFGNDATLASCAWCAW